MTVVNSSTRQLAGMGGSVAGVRRIERRPAQPVAGSFEPRSHRCLQDRAGGRQHAGDPASRQRPRCRSSRRVGRAQSLSGRHVAHRDRGSLSGRSRPRGLASGTGLRDRPVRRARRHRQHAPQPGQRAANHRRHSGHTAHEPEHGVPATDDRCVRYPRHGRLDISRRCPDRTGHHDAVTFPGGALAGLCTRPRIKPGHSAAYWDRVTAGFDHSQADQVPTAKFNRVLWKGMMGRRPYPATQGHADDAGDD